MKSGDFVKVVKGPSKYGLIIQGLAEGHVLEFAMENGSFYNLNVVSISRAAGLQYWFVHCRGFLQRNVNESNVTRLVDESKILRQFEGTYDAETRTGRFAVLA